MGSRDERDERGSKRRRLDSDDERKESHRRSRHDDRDRDERRRDRKARRIDLRAEGIPELTVDDFDARKREFREWLRDERDQVRAGGDARAALTSQRYDDLSSREAHRLFDDRFVRAWNKGKLDRRYYKSTSQSDARSVARIDPAQAEATALRTSADTAGPSQPRPMIGPARPPAPSTVAELHERREREREEAERHQRVQAAEKSRSRREAKEAEVSERATGRDRIAEKRAEARTSNRAFADRRADDAAPELDDSTLMGGSDSFAAALARERAREARGGRVSQARQARQEEREVELAEKRAAHSAKEAETLAMLRGLAAARFGA